MEKITLKISRRRAIVTGAIAPAAAMIGCGGAGWKDDIPKSPEAPVIEGMSVLRTMTLDGTGIYRWGDGTKALQRTPTFPPDVYSTVIPKNRMNGWPGYIEFAQDPLGERGTVMLSSVDPSPDSVPNNRSEIYSFPEPVRRDAPITRVYSYGVLIPSDDEFVAPDRYFSIQQIHDHPDPGDPLRWPNMIIMAGAGEFQVKLPLVSPPGEHQMHRTAGVYPLVRNKWHDIEVHIHLSVESTGWVKVLIDKDLVVDERGHATQYDDVEGPHFRLGMYNIWHHKSGANQRTGKVARAYFSNCWHYAPSGV